MQKNILHKLLRLYKKSDQLLRSGKFGEGLWPLDEYAGQIIHHLIRFHRLKSGLEVGAGVGYSTAWMISALRETGGRLTSFEYFLPKVTQWEKHMTQLFGEDYGKTVTMIPSDIERSLHSMGRKKYDLVFFDQRKEDYFPHLKLLFPRLKKGAFIVADNVISHEEFCQDYLKFVKNDPRFRSVTLSSGQGLEISRYNR